MEAAAARDVVDPFARMLALSRAFRRWAIGHPHEFGLLFAHHTDRSGPAAHQRLPAGQRPLRQPLRRRLHRHVGGRTLPGRDADDGLPEDLRVELDPYWTWLTANVAPDMPMGAVVRFLEGWVRIFGCVAMEAFGHLSWAMPDGEPMFEQVMRSLAEMVGRPDAYAPTA